MRKRAEAAPLKPLGICSPQFQEVPQVSSKFATLFNMVSYWVPTAAPAGGSPPLNTPNFLLGVSTLGFSISKLLLH